MRDQPGKASEWQPRALHDDRRAVHAAVVSDHLSGCAQRGDLPDSLADQLIWLMAAGFGEVDVFYRYVERVVFAGLKVPRQESRYPRRSETALLGMRGV